MISRRESLKRILQFAVAAASYGITSQIASARPRRGHGNHYPYGNTYGNPAGDPYIDAYWGHYGSGGYGWSGDYPSTYSTTYGIQYGSKRKRQPINWPAGGGGRPDKRHHGASGARRFESLTDKE